MPDLNAARLAELRAERDRLVTIADITPVRPPEYPALCERIADVCDEIAVHLYGPAVIDADRRIRLAERLAA